MSKTEIIQAVIYFISWCASTAIYSLSIKKWEKYCKNMADNNPDWISVDDRLPREKGTYLFYFDDGQIRVEGYFPDIHLAKCVTHWMNLPEPPTQ